MRQMKLFQSFSYLRGFSARGIAERFRESQETSGAAGNHGETAGNRELTLTPIRLEPLPEIPYRVARSSFETGT